MGWAPNSDVGSKRGGKEDRPGAPGPRGDAGGALGRSTGVGPSERVSGSAGEAGGVLVSVLCHALSAAEADKCQSRISHRWRPQRGEPGRAGNHQ